MNTSFQRLIAVYVFFVIIITGSGTTSAGLLDWLTSGSTSAQPVQSGSFDQLYASVLGPIDSDDNRPQVLANAVVSLNSPAANSQKVLRRKYLVEVSGYNSEVAQTDSNPFITAKGTHVRDGVVATNMFPFGTVIKLPSIFGDKIFVVEDRMNSRYQKHVDIWFESKTEALKLGRRSIQIEVIQ